MIQGFLRGKIPEVERMEDALTSAVFGRLRYLAPQSVLIPSLGQAVDCVSNQYLSDYLKALSIYLNDYNEADIVFWPRMAELGEPDLMIILSSSNHDVQELLLVVEVKYKSPKSGTGENDQLRRYFEAVTHHLKRFDNDRISNFAGRVGPIVYLTEFSAAEEIQASQKEIDLKLGYSAYPIFNLRWSSIYKSLLEVGETDQSGKLVIEDLISLLSYLNLQHFTGISSPAIEIMDVVTSVTPAFFFDIQATKKTAEYFTNLPTVNVELKEFCFLKGVNN